MRTKKALLNSIFSLLQQLIAVICGFILPKMFLAAFGSEVNGAVSSIAQFLGYISLLEAGVGGVTRAALYKPLAQKNMQEISAVANATQSFFQRLSYIFLIYAAVLAISFRYISHTGLSFVYTASLVLITAISTFAQYCFGITSSIILLADQRNYVSIILQIITTIVNTIISVILIELGAGIHFVKLCSTAIYVLRSMFLKIIVKRQYQLDKTVPPDHDAIKQRWNGLGQHIAFFVHNSTDVMVITACLGLKWVSVYNVYYMIVNGIRNIVNALTGGSEAAFGNMIARNEKEVLYDRFYMIETLSSSVIVIFFTTTGLLLIDFVKIYTSGVCDADYILPSFGILLVISEALHCIKQQYHTLVLAAGRYKETQVGAFIEAGLNILLSVIFVNIMGITGTIVATIISTAFRTIDYVLYLKKNILFRCVRIFVVRMVISMLNAISIIIIYEIIPLPQARTYLGWGLKAIPVLAIATLVTLLWNYLFFRDDLALVFIKIKSVFTKNDV